MAVANQIDSNTDGVCGCPDEELRPVGRRVDGERSGRLHACLGGNPFHVHVNATCVLVSGAFHQGCNLRDVFTYFVVE